MTGAHRQFKICTKGSCLRTVTGAAESPPHGAEIRDIRKDGIFAG